MRQGKKDTPSNTGADNLVDKQTLLYSITRGEWKFRWEDGQLPKMGRKGQEGIKYYL